MKQLKFIVLNLLISISVCAQTPGLSQNLTRYAEIPGTPKNLLSPNAASLGLYGEIPVSLYTGTPNISIPLYEMTYGNISVPISLSYHASGIKPDQHPGWVGLGWTMNAGGMISRVVKQLADDYCTYNSVSKQWSRYGYYFNNSILNGTDWSTSTLINIGQNTNGQYTYTDTEPDEFSFNFLDYSGKFYWDAKGFWRVKCDKPVKVILEGFSDMPDFNGVVKTREPKHFSGFTIIDEYGNKYIFGTDDYIEYSTNFFDQMGDAWTASSWMLNKIVLANGEEVKFKYERGPFTNQLHSSLTAELGMSNSDNLNWFQRIFTPGSESYSSSGLNISYGGQLISPIYLKSIISPNDSISFTHSYSKELNFADSLYYKHEAVYAYSDMSAPNMEYLKTAFNTDYPTYDYMNRLKNLQWQQLDKVSIFSKTGNSKIKSYDLLYSSASNQRLTLNSIIEKSNDDTEEGQRYFFEYYNINKLPPYFSNKVDHWGYYNGKYSLERPSLFNATQYFTKREPSNNVDTISVGTLRKIYYPTGGNTEFIYEPHDYQKQLNIDRWGEIENTSKSIAGGLRIRKIINNPNIGDSTQKAIVKNYFYQREYKANGTSLGSSGVLGGRIKYLFTNYKVSAYNSNNVTFSKNTFSSQSILPACENSGGSHIGYSEVIEKLADNSYSRVTFTNFDNGHKDEKYVNTIHENLSPYQPYNSKEMERGKMLTKSTYSPEGVIKSKKTISYKALGADTSFVKAVHAFNAVAESETAIYFADGSAYKIYTYPFLPVSESDSIYDGSTTPIVNISTMEYNAYNLLSLNKQLDSANDTIITRYKYSGDCGIANNTTVSTQDTLYPIFKWMKDNNMLAYPVEITNSKKKAGIGEKEWINSAKLQLYKKMKPTNATVDFCKLSSESNLSIKAPIQNNTDFKNINLYLTASNSTCVFDNRYTEKIRYNKYDAHGNPQSVTKNGVENSVYLWSYNYRYPVVEIKNATWADVSNYMSESQVSDMAKKAEPDATDLTLIGNLKTNLNSSQISTYKFKPLVGLTKATSPRETTIQYGYDNFNRLSTLNNNNNKVISQYQYDYVKFNETTTQTSSTLFARIYSSTKKFNIGDKDIANIVVVGGSGNYTYNWQLMNSSGTVLASQSSSSSTSFSYTYSQGGPMTIQCIVTDNQTGVSFTASTLRTVNYITGSFTMSANYYNITSNLTNYGTYVSFYIAFVPSITMVAGTSYLVANISPNCRPNVTRGFFYSSTDRNWGISINPNGDVYFTITAGGANLASGNGVGFGTLTYNL